MMPPDVSSRIPGGREGRRERKVDYFLAAARIPSTSSSRRITY